MPELMQLADYYRYKDSRWYKDCEEYFRMWTLILAATAAQRSRNAN